MALLAGFLGAGAWYLADDAPVDTGKRAEHRAAEARQLFKKLTAPGAGALDPAEVVRVSQASLVADVIDAATTLTWWRRDRRIPEALLRAASKMHNAAVAYGPVTPAREANFRAFKAMTKPYQRGAVNALVDAILADLATLPVPPADVLALARKAVK